jgi:hypothetical protein
MLMGSPRFAKNPERGPVVRSHGATCTISDRMAVGAVYTWFTRFALHDLPEARGGAMGMPSNTIAVAPAVRGGVTHCQYVVAKTTSFFFDSRTRANAWCW